MASLCSTYFLCNFSKFINQVLKISTEFLGKLLDALDLPPQAFVPELKFHELKEQSKIIIFNQTTRQEELAKKYQLKYASVSRK